MVRILLNYLFLFIFIREGQRLDPETSPEHSWAGVFLFGYWRLVDPSRASGNIIIKTEKIIILEKIL